MLHKISIMCLVLIVGFSIVLLNIKEEINIGDCVYNPKDSRYHFFVIDKKDQELKALYYSTEVFVMNYKNLVKITLNGPKFKRTLCPRRGNLPKYVKKRLEDEKLLSLIHISEPTRRS